MTVRTAVPSSVLSLLRDWKTSNLFANIEYEVDELRRDIKVVELAQKDQQVTCTFVHDKCVVEPGKVKTKDGRAYAVRVFHTREDISLTNHWAGVFSLASRLAASPSLLSAREIRPVRVRETSPGQCRVSS